MSQTVLWWVFLLQKPENACGSKVYGGSCHFVDVNKVAKLDEMVVAYVANGGKKSCSPLWITFNAFLGDFL